MVLDINLGHDFLDLIPKAKATKSKIQAKKVWHSKENQQDERQPIEWEKILANDISDNGVKTLYIHIYMYTHIYIYSHN